MFITKIKIKNFKAFLTEVSLDLNPNKNQIDSSLKWDQFHQRGEDFFICPVVSIGGANSMGKSSILDAIQTFFDFSFLKEKIKKEIEEDSSWRFFKSLEDEYEDGEKNEWILEFKRYIQKKIRSRCAHNHLKESTKAFDEKLSFFQMLEEKFEKFQLDNFNFIMQNRWNEYKKIKNEESYIEISLVIQNKEYTLVLKDEQTDNKWEPHTYILDNDNYILLDDSVHFSLFNDLINEKIMILGINNSFQQLKIMNSFSLWKKDNVEESAINIINYFNKDVFLNLVQIADKNIIDIYASTDPHSWTTSVGSFAYNDGSITEIKNISDGTKKFIILFEKILPIFKKEVDNVILLIDEIETHFHFGLADFFKRLIMNVSKNKDVQLFFTSHSPIVLSNYLSTKQIFLLDESRGVKKITKTSTVIKPNNSFVKNFFEEKIGFHPNTNDINNALGEILDYEK